jgi:F-type H+-transporting ATPase subunit b
MKKLILATLAGALFLTLAPAATAGASETVGACMAEVLEHDGVEHVETVLHDGLVDGATDEAKEELEALEEDFEDCLEAPSPIIPELNEIIWGGGAFAVLLGFMLWKGFPAVKNIMNARSEQIVGDLDEADRAKADAQSVKAQYEAELADAKTESARIIDEARQQAGAVRADLEARAQSDISDMRAQAATDVESARSRAMDDLQAEVSDIVVGAAERVIEANLDRDTQAQLIENYINNVGSR